MFGGMDRDMGPIWVGGVEEDGTKGYWLFPLEVPCDGKDSWE